MTMKWLQRIALFSFFLALTLPQIAAAQSAADNLQSKVCHVSWS